MESATRKVATVRSPADVEMPGNLSDPELWSKIHAHTLDAPSGSTPFSVKLARQEGWTVDFTRIVMDEYKRFVYLSQISKEQVTPSKVIDTAWHHHLTYTRDYWEEFVPNVLLRPLHHEPCRGDEEMPRYQHQFSETMALYEQEFGSLPPKKVWKPEKPRTWPLKLVMRLSFLWAAFVFWLVTNTSADSGESHFVIGLFLASPGLIVGVAISSNLVNSEKRDNGTSGCGGDGCGGCGGCGG